MIGQSPPTTSGIVIISGSNGFDPHTSDLPVVQAPIGEWLKLTFDPPVFVNPVTNPHKSLIVYEFNPLEVHHFEPSPGFIPSIDDISITSTSTTTSGVVIFDMFPNANVSGGPPPYIPPIYINQRIFPVSFSGVGERVFPEENRRIYPVLPQFSTLTPGG